MMYLESCLGKVNLICGNEVQLVVRVVIFGQRWYEYGILVRDIIKIGYLFEEEGELWVVIIFQFVDIVYRREGDMYSLENQEGKQKCIYCYRNIVNVVYN